jgi:integrase/recombinase XerD
MFSAEEIKSILHTVSGLGKRNAFRGHTFNPFFALLAWLRVSKAIHLCFQDITADGLVIRCSKFRKSGLVSRYLFSLSFSEWDSSTERY